MRVLVIGSGGREHALCWRLAQCESVSQVLAIPGNPGIEQVAECNDIPQDADTVAAFCKASDVQLVVIGPERPLIAGLADALRDQGVAVYGPSADCAQIEGSKAFSKRLMLEEGIPTARYQTFTESKSAIDYIRTEYSLNRSVVVKASGEALGKGVIVAADANEACAAAIDMLDNNAFGDAGATIVIEEQLSGEEASLLAVCSGEQYRVLPSARDYKSAFDGGRGPNTGGMGSVSPGPKWSEGLAETFVAPILRRFVRDGTPYIGTLYCGLMNTIEGPKALEYNARFGDPETQVLMPRVEGDFAQLLYAAATSAPLPELHVSHEAAACVVIAADGYPGDYKKGIALPELPGEDVVVFHAGTRREGDAIVSSGGRVLGITAVAASMPTACERAYAVAERFKGPDWNFRTDIGDGLTIQ